MLDFSTKRTADYDKFSIFIYISEGLFVLLVNMFLAVRLFTNRHLRAQKEFVVIGSCIIFDIFFGITYFSAGLYRFIVILQYDYFPLVSMFDCFATVHNQLFIIITIMAGIQLLATAIDRFFCIFFPFSYIRLQVEYAYCLMFISYFFVVPLWIPGAVGAFQNREIKNFTMNCLLNQSIPVLWYTNYRIIRILCTVLCILIYIPVFSKVFYSVYKHTRLIPGSSRNNTRLLNMTKTVGLITGSTFVLFTIPDLITMLYPFITSNIFYLMNLNKGVVNILIFMTTQKTLRTLMFPMKDKNMMNSEMFSSRKVTPTILIHAV
ncbi:unnamed protein product [Caenorhabditis angaria]|uniref:G-protein coupled receptors family 1 profile domain-containing protein n=1 Tax=Caenorhabditis angaria TaxID=860376 RepID=A0A9P1IX52_9PELO|nr:unnamed protein product [Caenorhabditis angaria]